MSNIKFNQEFSLEFTVDKVLNDANTNYLCVFAKNIKYNTFNKKLNNIKDINIEHYDGFKPAQLLIRGYFLSVFAGDRFQALGKFTTYQNKHEDYKEIIELTSIPILIKSKSIDNKIKKIPGLKKNSLEKIKDYLLRTLKNKDEIKFSDIIDAVNKDNRFLDTLKINDIEKESLINWCDDNKNLEPIAITLMAYGITPDVACKLYKIYGVNALYFLSKDPYEAYHYNCMRFSEIDKLVEDKIKNVNKSVNRLSALIISAINTAYQNGDMCISYSKLIKNVKDNNIKLNGLKENYIFNDEEINKQLESLIKNKRVVVKNIKTSNGNIDYYYSSSNFYVEDTLANKIAKMSKEKSPLFSFTEDIKKSIKNLSLSTCQKEAVVMGLTNKLSIITGGAGTGKTWTINAIIDELKTTAPKVLNRSVSFALLAPTGKAAARIREVSKEEAVTIHSKFQLIDGVVESYAVLKNNNKNIQNEDFIIIDEASMIDEKLFNYLMTHISDNTCIILSGDSNQLPSVEAGNVLNEMISYELCEHIELDKVYRQAITSDIINNSFLIKDAKPESINKINFKNGNDFVWIEEDNEEKIKDLLLAEYDKLLANKVKPEDIMLLSPIHGGITGTNELNQIIESKVNNSLLSTTFGERTLKVNDRIILTQNLTFKINKSKMRVCNGDLGYINAFEYNEKTGKTTTLIKFDAYDTLIPIKESNINFIELAYSITIHKSQGSEIKYVLMPIIDNYQTKSLLTNRLIYTGVTRAKTKFIGIGSSATFKEICLKKDYIKRQTNLGYFAKNLLCDKTIYK